MRIDDAGSRRFSWQKSGGASTWIGVLLLGLGSAGGLLAAYTLIQFSAWAGLFPADPEEIYGLPALIATPSILLAAWGHRLLRNRARRSWIRLGIGAIQLPGLLTGLLAGGSLLWIKTLPLHHPTEHKLVAVDWRIHDRLSDRVVLQLPGCKYSPTLLAQPGLIAHLRRHSETPTLNYDLVRKYDGRPLRIYPRTLAGVELTRQHWPGSSYECLITESRGEPYGPLRLSNAEHDIGRSTR